jgi:23S rRNA pseudouridine2605 synthase
MVDHKYNPTDDSAPGQGADASGDRIAKVLARAGVASRREIERLIEAGRVAINGQVLTTPAVKVAPGDIVTVDGKVVDEPEPTRVWRYHKPVGLLTSHNDPKGRPTVFQNLPPGMPRVISVGRLDLNSEGLLILTNDGELARALEMPATGIVRRYRARARGRTTQEKLDRLKDGITVEGVRYSGIEARLDKVKEGAAGANLWITLTLAEGKNREVRRVLEALGLTVNRLIRLAYGPFQLGDLATGHAEEVGPRVIREQLAEHIDPANLPTGDRTPKAAPKSKPRSGKAFTDPTPVEKEKLVYKPGWAKPKKKLNPHAPKRGGPAKAVRDEKRAGKTIVTPSARRAAAKPGAAPPRPGGRPGAHGKPRR